jgi:hypothetical protein
MYEFLVSETVFGITTKKALAMASLCKPENQGEGNEPEQMAFRYGNN